MVDTVVLGGDQSVQILEDGNLDLVTMQDGDSSILSVESTEPELLLVADGDMDLSIVEDGEPTAITKVNEGAYPAYTGATEITPSTETQILATANRSVLSNIVINPIPNNYGLITWDGATLTVS